MSPVFSKSSEWCQFFVCQGYAKSQFYKMTPSLISEGGLWCPPMGATESDTPWDVGLRHLPWQWSMWWKYYKCNAGLDGIHFLVMLNRVTGRVIILKTLSRGHTNMSMCQYSQRPNYWLPWRVWSRILSWWIWFYKLYWQCLRGESFGEHIMCPQDCDDSKATMFDTS